MPLVPLCENGEPGSQHPLLFLTPPPHLSIPLYTLYGHLLEEYHHDGRGCEMILTLYRQKQEALSQSQNSGVIPSSASINSIAGIDLELVSKTVDMERRRRNHDEALAILSDVFKKADKEHPRFDDTLVSRIT